MLHIYATTLRKKRDHLLQPISY
ncbi:hypothetical protein Zm00014a_013664 [Zea mays]|uniref:Uncharacterized protein n=1 Tax=Zea mays TaxID=4577 RepID=A0A3L6E5Y5_MAIZE|nr:hypothetical protein Zm00014a_013664 [Zea mays]